MFPKKLLLLITVFLSALSYALAQDVTGQVFYNANSGDTTVVELGRYTTDSATGITTFNLYDRDSLQGSGGYSLDLNGNTGWHVIVRAYLSGNSSQASQYDTTYYGDAKNRMGAIQFVANANRLTDSVNINLLKTSQNSSAAMPLTVNGSMLLNGLSLPGSYSVTLDFKLKTDAGHAFGNTIQKTVNVSANGYYSDTVNIPAITGKIKPKITFRNCAQQLHTTAGKWNHSINDFSSSPQSITLDTLDYCPTRIIKVQAQSPFFNPASDDLLYILYKQMSNGSWSAVDSIFGDTAHFPVTGNLLNNSFTASAEMTTGSANWGKTVKTYYHSTTNSSLADTIHPPSGAIRNATINLQANSSGVPTKNTQITASLTGAPDGTNVDVYLHYIGQGKSGRDTLQGTITNSVIKVFSSIPKLRYTINTEFAYQDCKGNNQNILKSKFVGNMDSTVHYGVLPWCKNLGSKKIEGDVYHPTTFLPGDSIYMSMYEVTYDAYLNKKQYKRVNLSWNNSKFVANSSPAHYTLNLPSGSNANTYVLKADFYRSSAFGTYYGDDTRRTHATAIHFNGSHLTGYDINLQSGASSGPKPQYISGYAGLESSSVQDSIHVLLIKQSINSQGDTLLNVAQSHYLTNSSYYQFVLNGGIASTYYVKGYLDSNAANYGSYLPTYVGQTPFWNAADSINTTGSSQIILGQLDLLAGNFSGGPGFVSGKVNAGAGKRSSGEEGVDMILTDMNDDPVAFNTTDAQGIFQIANLPYGDYKLRAEVPGKQSDVHSFTLNSGDPSETSVIFRSDSTRIVLVSVSLDEHPLLRGLQAYPNPAQDKLHLQWDDRAPMTWKLQNISGEVIRRGAVDPESRSILDLSAINSGMYLLQIRSQGETAARKIIVR